MNVKKKKKRLLRMGPLRKGEKKGKPSLHRDHEGFAKPCISKPHRWLSVIARIAGKENKILPKETIAKVWVKMCSGF